MQVERWSLVKHWIEDVIKRPDASRFDEATIGDDVIGMRNKVKSALCERPVNPVDGLSFRSGLLVGPPGTGKVWIYTHKLTMQAEKTLNMCAWTDPRHLCYLFACVQTASAEWIAASLQISFFSVAPSEIESKWHGEDTKRFDAIFQAAKMTTPLVLMFDEGDKWFPNRAASSNGSQSEGNPSATSSRLPYLSGDTAPVRGLSIVVATNYSSKIDAAVKDRLSNNLAIPPADHTRVCAMYMHYLKKKGVLKDVPSLTIKCKFIQKLAAIAHPKNLRDIPDRVTIIKGCINDFNDKAIDDRCKKLDKTHLTEEDKMQLHEELMAAPSAQPDNKLCPLWNALPLIQEELRRQRDAQAMEAAEHHTSSNSQPAPDSAMAAAAMAVPTSAAAAAAAAVHKNKRKHDQENELNTSAAAAASSTPPSAKRQKSTASSTSSSNSSVSVASSKPTARNDCVCSQQTSITLRRKTKAKPALNRPAGRALDSTTLSRHDAFRQLTAKETCTLVQIRQLVESWGENDIARWLFSTEAGMNGRPSSCKFVAANNVQATYSELRRSYEDFFNTKEHQIIGSEKEKHLWDVLRTCFCANSHAGSVHFFKIKMQ